MKFINVQLIYAINPLTSVCVWGGGGVHISPSGVPSPPMKSLPLCMARHAAANHRPQEDKPDVRGRERGQQGEVGSPQE